MGVVMNATKPVVQEMRSYDQSNRWNEQPGIIMHKEQFQHQQGQAQCKQAKWTEAMMVAFVAVVKRPGTDGEGKKDHARLKSEVMDDIYAK